MRKIQIICPICFKTKRIPIPKEIFEIDEGSLLKLPIEKGIVCEHDMIIVVDYNFSIRDYEIPGNSQEFYALYNKLKKNANPASFSYF